MTKDSIEKLEKEIEERSKNILNMFNQFKNKPLKDFPAPPFTKWLNGQILYAERGKVIVEFEIRPEMGNPTGILHGGAQAGMIDDTIGMTCATLGYKGFLLTVDLRIDYLGRVPIGQKVEVEGLIIREGKSIVNAEATIKKKDGIVIAKAISNLLRTTTKPDYNKIEYDKMLHLN